jgi:hypothetical protein
MIRAIASSSAVVCGSAVESVVDMDGTGALPLKTWCDT